MCYLYDLLLRKYNDLSYLCFTHLRIYYYLTILVLFYILNEYGLVVLQMCWIQ